MSRISGLIIGGILLFVSMTFAAPNLINYQGTLTDGVGAPVDGDYSMEFVIYDDELTGSMVWGESHIVVSVANGIYNVQLGSGALLPLSPPLSPELFAAPSLWLEVTVEGETLTPRQRLLAVPYAMTAASLAPGVVPCNPGDFVNCYSGQNGTMNIGICQSGTRTCDPAGIFGSCSGEVVPATEICNDLDDDCNGLTDDNATDASTWYSDTDTDGYGDIASIQSSCNQPEGYVADSSDCNDAEPTVHPSAYEVCDGLDNDCNSLIDDNCGQPQACNTSETIFFGTCAATYSDPAQIINCAAAQVSQVCISAIMDLGFCGANFGCGDPITDVACYETNCPVEYLVYAGGPPECTFGTTRVCGTDVGECQSGIESCVYGGLWEGVCAGSIGPEEEICGNGLDDDCNGTADDILYSWCLDLDGDGAIQLDSCTKVCAAESFPNYYLIPDDNLPEYQNDCNDNDPNVNPWSLEICGDGVDNDCNAATPDIEDLDSDGYDCSVDCDDSNQDINPGVAETCADGIDNDCNVSTLDIFDGDGDGYDCQNDCDDSDALVNPGEEDICDGIDNNCDTQIDETCGECATPYIVDSQALPYVYSGITYDALNNLNPSCSGGEADGPEHVFEFTPTTTALYSISLTANFDTVLYLLGDCYDENSCSSYNDEIGVGGEIIDQVFTSGVTYFIVVDGWSGHLGDYELTIHFAIDNDSDGFSVLTDCDDTNSDVFPGNTEICDGLDNDCDSTIDNNFTIGVLCGAGECAGGFTECSGDGFSTICSTEAGGSSDNSSTEICGDVLDNNCDGQVDEGCLGLSCDDGDLCTTNDIYVDISGFVVCEGSPMDCSGLNDACNYASCNASTGNCDLAPLTGQVCDDADPGTFNDACDAGGSCIGTPYSCNDGLFCTVDIPDGQGGCSYTAAAGSCFIGGACYADQQPNPANPCQICDSANSPTTWSNSSNVCDDANSSTYNDICVAGSCVGTPYSCDDGLSCTVDTPDGQGGCTNTIVAGYCAIGGSCYADQSTNPVNECQMCASATSTTTWSSKVDGSACGGSPASCYSQDICLNGICSDSGYSPAGTSCGDSTDNACTNPDTCNGAGICYPNNAPAGTPCGSGQTCNTTGICI